MRITSQVSVRLLPAEPKQEDANTDDSNAEEKFRVEVNIETVQLAEQVLC